MSITTQYLRKLMSQSTLLVSALKQLLKSQNITYKDVAKRLAMSEASIKRMFANNQLSLERIDIICDMLGIEIADLLQKMQHMSKRITQLTLAQEQTIVSDRKLCLVTICVINHWSYDEIMNYYNLTAAECFNYLAKLDAIKFIELLPKNRIKLLISPRFSWIANGPIQNFFQQYIMRDFIDSSFQKANEEMICQFGMLTPESNTLFRKKLRHLAEEFLVLSEQDAGEKIEKRVGSACVLMVRPWAPAIFNEFIRKE
jgi:DNA-binding Xre family transcriptional regulator